MNNIIVFRDTIIVQAFSTLPERMRDKNAELQLCATAIQESNFEHRWQFPNGPAVSYYQMEPICIRDVLERASSRGYALNACELFNVKPDVKELHKKFRLADFDVLSTVFARLNYWNDKDLIPEIGREQAAYNYYDDIWRPGKKRPGHWAESYWRAYGALIG